MLSFADFRENTRFCARSFKSLKSVVQRFVIFYSDFRHHIPSLCLRGRGLKAGSATVIRFAKRTSSRLTTGSFQGKFTCKTNICTIYYTANSCAMSIGNTDFSH